MVLTAFHTALHHWVDNGGNDDLAELADQTLSAVAPALDLTAGAS